jgi:UDP-N-acetylglucosamine acyltransferase
MPTIHPNSVVEPGAELASDVRVGPFCYVGRHVCIGEGTQLFSHVAIHNRTTLGRNNRVWSGAVLGADPQDLKFKGEPAELIIGDNNDLRECATIHIGTQNGGNVTRVGSDNLIMAYVHIGHDSMIGSHCVIANAVQIAGHVHLHDHANIGGAAAVHHYVTIGQYSFIGGMTRIIHDVPPFMIVEGNPSRVRGVNQIGLTRHRFPEEQINRLWEAYRLLYRERGAGQASASMRENLIALENHYPGDECIRLLIHSLRNTTVGLHGRHREGERSDNRHQNPVK